MSHAPVGQLRAPARRRSASASSDVRTDRRPPRRTARGTSAGGRASGARRLPAATPDQANLDRLLDAAQLVADPAPSTFAELGLPPALVTALRRRGVQEPFAIQARALPDALAGRDVLGRAQTGSGKTLAFGLPLLTRLAAGSGRRASGAPRGLVLVPTRELAEQVAGVLAPLGHAVGVRLATVYGGVPYGRQLSSLERGVDVVIATPGRLVDLIERRACRLDQVEVSVLDEADYMADLGFLPVVTGLLEQTPGDCQRMLFSATLDRGVATLVTRFLRDPAAHAVAAAFAPVEAAEHRVFTVSRQHKVAVAAEVAGRPGRTLFFVRTKHGADRLVTQFATSGVEAAAIHGDLRQSARQRALSAFAAGSTRVLVATDVAARGIHVDDVDLVVHFDPPNDHKDYLHRSGRTARAGAVGTVVALAYPDQVHQLSRLHEAARVTPTVLSVAPGHEAVRQLATSGRIELPSPERRTERPKKSYAPPRGGRRAPKR